MCDHCGCEQHAHAPEGHDHGAEHAAHTRRIRIEQDVLAHQKAHAEAIRRRLYELDCRLVNIIGSPGCGKTELLSALIAGAHLSRSCAVLEGDLATDNDARRIRATGAPVYQIQTGTACHLSAHDVEHGLDQLPLERGQAVLVENVGNLVCPSMFDIGEALRLVCLSVTEGTDKPQKYPVSFREAGLAVITKTDLLPYVDFDVAACQDMITTIAPQTRILLTSARSGEGLEALAHCIEQLWSHP